MKGYKPGYVPLERALSKLGLASRSQAREMIWAGQVRVNGQTRLDPQFAVVPETAKIEMNQEPVSQAEPQTFMLYKPRGYVTTRSDEKGRATVFSLLRMTDVHLISVGRLDWATSGLLLLTNDTRLAERLTNPENRVRRTYLVSVRGLVTEAKVERLRGGIEDDGEVLRVDGLELRKASSKESHLTLHLTEGKNREVRRLFKAIGHEVTKLKRVAFGQLELGGLQPGEYRELSEAEIELALSEG